MVTCVIWRTHLNFHTFNIHVMELVALFNQNECCKHFCIIIKIQLKKKDSVFHYSLCMQSYIRRFKGQHKIIIKHLQCMHQNIYYLSVTLRNLSNYYTLKNYFVFKNKELTNQNAFRFYFTKNRRCNVACSLLDVDTNEVISLKFLKCTS